MNITSTAIMAGLGLSDGLSMGTVRSMKATPHPGPWLKDAPPKGRYFQTMARKGSLRLSSDGRVYEVKHSGWRRRQDIEKKMAVEKAAKAKE